MLYMQAYPSLSTHQLVKLDYYNINNIQLAPSYKNGSRNLTNVELKTN